MENLSWLPYLVSVLTAIIGVFSGKYLTRREKKKTDIQLIQEAINPLLESITGLTDHNNNLIEKLLAEQLKNLELIQERAGWMIEKQELVSKIDKLERKVTTLAKEIKKLRDEKDDTDIDDRPGIDGM